MYEVIVDNIGRVASESNLQEAAKIYREYKDQSVKGVGKAAGEAVTIFDTSTDEPVRGYEYRPPLRLGRKTPKRKVRHFRRW